MLKASETGAVSQQAIGTMTCRHAVFAFGDIVRAGALRHDETVGEDVADWP
ncbi:MAG: hypothetical protein ACXV8P_08060 [Methylobacter sp.]